MAESPHEWRIESFLIKNLFAVWPTKLTLAPRVSSEIVAKIRNLMPRGRAVASPLAGQRYAPVGVAPERWRTTSLMPWNEFQRTYHL